MIPLPDGVTGHYRKDKLVFEVDTDKQSYKGRKWKALSNFDKRKWENLLFLKHPTELPVFIYH